MKVTAICNDGMGKPWTKEVTKINAWGKNHRRFEELSQFALQALLEEVEETGQMQVYDSDFKSIDGHLDANPSTPLYTNGQKTVIALIVDEKMVWQR
jgi:hypothetical protein